MAENYHNEPEINHNMAKICLSLTEISSQYGRKCFFPIANCEDDKKNG